jgi:hypothetical protein
MKCSGVKMSVVIALLHALAVSHPDNIIRTGKIPFSLKKKKVSIHFSQPPTHSHRRRRRMQSGKLLIIAGIKSDSTIPSLLLPCSAAAAAARGAISASLPRLYIPASDQQHTEKKTTTMQQHLRCVHRRDRPYCTTYQWQRRLRTLYYDYRQQ